MSNVWVSNDGYTKVAQVADEFVVAQEGFGWLPGVFASVEDARSASAAYDAEHGRQAPEARPDAGSPSLT